MSKDSDYAPYEVALNWHGREIDAKQAALAREWNEKAATGFYDELTYRKYRKQMNEFGLPGSDWHVGHIAPNEPGSGRGGGPEDLSWNLMALDRYDNIRISDDEVSQEVLDFWHRGTPNY